MVSHQFINTIWSYRASDMWAVSYTHLDVYKRQPVRRSKKTAKVTLGSLLGAFILAGLSYFSPQWLPESDALRNNAAATPVHTQVNSALTVHFIDVGQADAILIQSGAEAMIIDAGNNADAKQMCIRDRRNTRPDCS